MTSVQQSEQPRPQGLSSSRLLEQERETLVWSGHVRPKIWDVAKKRIVGSRGREEERPWERGCKVKIGARGVRRFKVTPYLHRAFPAGNEVFWFIK